MTTATQSKATNRTTLTAALIGAITGGAGTFSVNTWVFPPSVPAQIIQDVQALKSNPYARPDSFTRTEANRQNESLRMRLDNLESEDFGIKVRIEHLNSQIKMIRKILDQGVLPRADERLKAIENLHRTPHEQLFSE